ncbi:hypothetical protein [Candidatus Hodgkinia cicadicola]
MSWFWFILKCFGGWIGFSFGIGCLGCWFSVIDWEDGLDLKDHSD